MVNIRKYSIAVTKFRCANHKLEIEIGRHNKIEKNERLCKYCKIVKNVKIIEDEFHFVCECEQYNELRLKYNFPAQMDYYEFVNLMKTKNIQTTRNLACFYIPLFK